MKLKELLDKSCLFVLEYKVGVMLIMGVFFLLSSFFAPDEEGRYFIQFGGLVLLTLASFFKLIMEIK